MYALYFYVYYIMKLCKQYLNTILKIQKPKQTKQNKASNK